MSGLVKTFLITWARAFKNILHILNIRLRLNPALKDAHCKLLTRPVGKVVALKKGSSLSIVQFSTYDRYGGAALVANNLHSSLNRLGHDSVMLVKEKTSNDNKIVAIVNKRKDEQFLKSCSSRGLLYKNYLSTFDLPELEAFKKSKIIHFHNLHGNYFNYLALPGIVRLKPSIWTLHDMQSITGHCAHSMGCEKWKTGCGLCPLLNEYPAVKRDSTKELWQEKKSIYKGLDIDIVVPSKWLSNIVKQSILSNKNIHVIYNGINPDTFYPRDKEKARASLDIAVDRTVLVTTAAGGRKNPSKGGQQLLEALTRVGSKQDIIVVNIGDDSPSPGIQGVHWVSTGHIYDQSEVNNWYSVADIFLFPSIAENCPLAVLEAMACGLPSVVFDTGGIPELIDHMECGYIAKYKDVDDLVKGINLFINDSELRKKSGENARKKIENQFTLQSMTNSYLSLYYDVINRRANSREPFSQV